MKKIATIIMTVFVEITFSFGQTQEALTSEGKRVILNPDKTWKYAEMTQDTIVYNQETLIGGCWFYPNDAPTNIAFYKDFTFKFNTHQDLKIGTYTISESNIFLQCCDGTKYQFLIYDIQYLKSYPLEKKEYYLVHSEDWVHPNLK